MIRSGGENVYPAEIEMIITSHDDIVDAAVVGVPDDRYTEVGAAIVVAGEGRDLDVDELREYLLERIAKFKVPRYFRVVDELPRNANGKVQKTVLRERYRDVGVS